MSSVLTPALVEQLSAVSTATLATQLFKRGIRQAFLNGLEPLSPQACRFVAEAVTLRYIPAREDLDTLAVYDDYDHPQRAAIERTGPGQVLVVDSRGRPEAASAGHILISRLIARGAAGFVTDGSLRDAPDIAGRDFPCFAAGRSATTNLALHHAVDIDVPIGCAEVAVYPRDVLVADAEGVICIPRELAVEVAADAVEQERLESFLLAKVVAGAPLRGTYPPDEATRAEYLRWQEDRDADER